MPMTTLEILKLVIFTETQKSNILRTKYFSFKQYNVLQKVVL